MKIPFKIYPLDDHIKYSNSNDLIRKYLYCPLCFNKSLDLKVQETILSVFYIKAPEPVFVCSACNKKVEPINLSEMREEKIKKINKYE